MQLVLADRCRSKFAKILDNVEINQIIKNKHSRREALTAEYADDRKFIEEYYFGNCWHPKLQKIEGNRKNKTVRFFCLAWYM